ncbi:MAG: mitochondrial fission ELM1 family protein [Acetobacteraceae bacterium]|nr:mitochondrial fission ELM1 family protein [Acetobacteraceae bacterium]
MPLSSWILSEGYAGLQAQVLGLAEAASLDPELRVLEPRPPWRWAPAALWPAPLAAVGSRVLSPPWPDLLIGCGGVAAAVGAGMRRRGKAVVQVQHPRMDPRKFDLVVVNRHDELTGPNVLVTRTALHRVTPERLAEAARVWGPRLAHLPRPLVAVLVGGTNGRFRLNEGVGRQLASELATMMRLDKTGLALTPSRRTDPAVNRVLREVLAPLGAWIWDGSGDNPYFGLLALADAFVVTMDSVSMVSESVATHAPVMLARLPGRSRRIGLFAQGLIEDGRIRPFAGRLETWPVEPVNDTQEAAAEMRRRLGF